MEPKTTLQGTNISHLGKRKIIFKMPLKGDIVGSQKGIQKARETNSSKKNIPLLFNWKRFPHENSSMLVQLFQKPRDRPKCNVFPPRKKTKDKTGGLTVQTLGFCI